MKDYSIIKQQFGIIGKSKELDRAIEIALAVAPTELSVLITGENGSGKESFSKIIHQNSKNKHGKFIALNCGNIPEGTIDSELFGHEKGAFTGATDSRKGYFEEVNNGTIFLDEIAELPLHTQARLLRILEQGEFIRVGSSKVMKTNVRVIAATNVNLLDQVYKKKFREDLYYRLNTVPIVVPPLRDRGDDILFIFRKFASDFSEKYNVSPVRLDEEAQKCILTYRFPGNIRQLKNITNQISLLEKNRIITKDILEKYLPKENTDISIHKPSDHNHTKADNPETDIFFKALFAMKNEINELKKTVYHLYKYLSENSDFKNAELETANKDINKTEFANFEKQDTNPNDSRYIIEDENLSLENKEKELIIKALTKFNHKRKKAAHELGISERTLYRKIKQYNIDEE